MSVGNHGQHLPLAAVRGGRMRSIVFGSERVSDLVRGNQTPLARYPLVEFLTDVIAYLLHRGAAGREESHCCTE